MKKLYFINQSFECCWRPHTDLCVVTWITKDDFMKIYKQVDDEWIKECEDWIHWDWFYDKLECKIKKAWWELECINDENVVLDSYYKHPLPY